jgi:hypothetical protein
MLITDLSYLENVSENESILGSASLLGITSYASAEGDDTYTLALADVDIKNKKRKTIATGIGIALAIGEDPYANVDVYYEGFDKVKIKTKYREGENYAFEIVKVKAIDLPNK